MNMLMEALAGNVVWVVIGSCFMVGIVAKAITTIVTSQARERSRREIAAYVAEGSITPEHGERLIKARMGGSDAA